MDGVIVTFKVTMALQKFLVLLGEKIATWQKCLAEATQTIFGSQRESSVTLL